MKNKLDMAHECANGSSMGDIIQKAIDASRGKKKKKTGEQVGSPTAAPAQEGQAQGAVDDFFTGSRKRRQIASTVQGGQVKRNTLG